MALFLSPNINLDIADATVLEYLHFITGRRHGSRVANRLYANFEDFVLLNGRYFKIIPFPAKYKRHTACLKACFFNAYMLMS